MDMSTVLLVLVVGIGAIATGFDYDGSARRLKPVFIRVRANRH